MGAINPNQLRMLMTPGEIMSQYSLSDGDRDVVKLGPGKERLETDSEVLDRKYRQAMNKGPKWGPSLRDQIRNEGVQEPIDISAGVTEENLGWSQKDFVLDGHHRLAVAARDRPNDLIPVRHHMQDDIGHGLNADGSPKLDF